MKTLRVQVTAEDIAAADNHPGAHWWAWPVQTALEGVIGADVDIDRDVPEGYMATIGAQDETATLVLTLDVNVEAFLDARYERDIPGEPFFFELSLPDWLCALVAP